MKESMKRAILTVFMSSLLCTPGCVSHYRVQEMETRILVLETQLKQTRDDLKSKNTQNQANLEHVSSEFKSFSDEVFKSIDGLRKGSAHDSVNIDGLKATIEQLQGHINELKFKLQQSKTSAEEAESPQLPEDKNALYDWGIERLKGKEFRKAIIAFTEFVKRYPDEIRADDSLFHIADAYYEQTRYEESIEIIEQILKNYADQNQAEKALILLHDNYIAIDQCSKGVDALHFLKENYPRSNQRRIAQRKLKKVRCK